MALAAALASVEYKKAPVRIRDRHPVQAASSHFMEVLRCEDAAGRAFKILCKYGHRFAWGGADHVEQSQGHRGGVPYEAEIYRHLVAPSGLSAPRFYGSYTDDEGRTWLFLEHLEGAKRLSKAVPYEDGLIAAARWVAQFHAAYSPPKQAPADLRMYDVEYFAGWLQRSVLLLRRVATAPAWLQALSDSVEDWIRPLTGEPISVIHGEYYMRNILYLHGAVLPVDWESAAVGAGEIDLAALTEAVEEELVLACLSAYRETRWPETEPADLDRRLRLARFYLHIRWLGEHERPTARQHEWRVPQMRREALALGLI